MRHGMMVRSLAAALLALAAGGLARAADGCNTCTPAVVHGVGHKADGPHEKHSLLNRVKNNTNVCCDAKFIFGSSKSFFSPCGGGCSDLPISAIHDRQRCGAPKYGTGIGQPANGCAGPYTYLSR